MQGVWEDEMEAVRVSRDPWGQTWRMQTVALGAKASPWGGKSDLCCPGLDEDAGASRVQLVCKQLPAMSAFLAWSQLGRLMVAKRDINKTIHPANST